MARHAAASHEWEGLSIDELTDAAWQSLHASVAEVHAPAGIRHPLARSTLTCTTTTSPTTGSFAALMLSSSSKSFNGRSPAGPAPSTLGCGAGGNSSAGDFWR